MVQTAHTAAPAKASVIKNAAKASRPGARDAGVARTGPVAAVSPPPIPPFTPVVVATPVPAVVGTGSPAATAQPSAAPPATVEIATTGTNARPSPASPPDVPLHSPPDPVPPDPNSGLRIAWQTAAVAPDRNAATAPHSIDPLPGMCAVDSLRAPALAATAPATASASHAPDALARQVAPTIELLARAGGSHSVVVQLHPDGLGKIELRIERAAGGAATVSLTAERPETARALEHARPMLEAALDRAGLDPARSSLTVAAQPVAVPAHIAPAHTASSPTAGTPAPGAGGGFGMAGGGQRQASRQGAQPPASDASGPDDGGVVATAGHRPRIWRLGVDITA